MKPREYSTRKQKWEKYSRDYKLNSCREATFILTAENTLKLLEGKKEGKMLDIGCGFGEIDILLAQKTNFEIIGCDISSVALEAAKENIRKAGLEHRLKVEIGDVYSLTYPDRFFDVVVSFGLVSAATYPGVQKNIARVLKPSGVLVCDFINCLSFYKFFKSLGRLILRKEYPYYLTLSGILREFEKEGLIFRNQCFFNTYPSLSLNLNSKFFLAFENSFGRLLRNFFGRVRLVCFSSTLK